MKRVLVLLFAGIFLCAGAAQADLIASYSFSETPTTRAAMATMALFLGHN